MHPERFERSGYVIDNQNDLSKKSILNLEIIEVKCRWFVDGEMLLNSVQKRVKELSKSDDADQFDRSGFFLTMSY